MALVLDCTGERRLSTSVLCSLFLTVHTVHLVTFFLQPSCFPCNDGMQSPGTIISYSSRVCFLFYGQVRVCYTNNKTSNQHSIGVVATEEPLGTHQNSVNTGELCFHVHEGEKMERRMWSLGRAMQCHSVRRLTGLTTPYTGKYLTHSLAERTVLCLSLYARHFSGHS